MVIAHVGFSVITMLAPEGLKGNDTQALIFQAELAKAQGNFMEAIVYLNQAIADEPESKALRLRGVCRAELDCIDGAVADLRAALEMDPRDALTHRLLGDFLREHGMLSDSLMSLREGQRLDPESAQGWYSLGRTLLAMAADLPSKPASITEKSRKRFLGRAYAAFDNALDENPRFQKPRFFRCVVSFAESRQREAYGDLILLLRDDNQPAAWLYRVSRNLCQIGSSGDAIALLEKARTLSGQEGLQSDIIRLLSALYVEMGEVERSRLCLDELLRLTPDDWEARLWAGDAAASLGDWENSAGHYRRVIEDEVGPGRERGLVALSRLLLMEDMRDEAFRVAQASFEAGFRSPRLLEVLSSLAEAQGDEELAIRSFTILSEQADADPSLLESVSYLRALSSRLVHSHLDDIRSLERACFTVLCLAQLSDVGRDQMRLVSSAKNSLSSPAECREILIAGLLRLGESLSGVPAHP